MRAEAQAHIDQIDAAMALVRRFLDWDRAVRRLDELNNRVEDPKLWDDPKSPIIWEAFKPESEPRRLATKQELAAAQAPKPQRAVRNDSDFLQQQGGIY